MTSVDMSLTLAKIIEGPKDHTWLWCLQSSYDRPEISQKIFFCSYSLIKLHDI
jgi:hypothetical protein